jgi:hypothetical protein
MRNTNEKKHPNKNLEELFLGTLTNGLAQNAASSSHVHLADLKLGKEQPDLGERELQRGFKKGGLTLKNKKRKPGSVQFCAG